MFLTQFFSLIKKIFNTIITVSMQIWVGLPLAFSLKSYREENTTGILEHPQNKTDHKDLKEDLERLHDVFSSILKQLKAAEEEIQHLKTELSEEKIIWSNAFQEMLHELQSLKQQLQNERETNLNEDASGALTTSTYPTEDATDGEMPLLNVVQEELHMCAGSKVNSTEQNGKHLPSCSQQKEPPSQGGQPFPVANNWSNSYDRTSAFYTLKHCSSKRSSVVSLADSTRGDHSHRPFRVFVPHTHLELCCGHRVKVLIAAWKVAMGVVMYLGYLPGMAELYVGLDLEAPEHGQLDGVFAGHRYFLCKPGHGTFVPFSKVLLAWE